VNEELELLKNIARRLDKAGIEYMMTGSMAMSFYSNPRMTRDIDVVVNITQIDAKRFAALFKNDFYVDETVIAQAVRDKGMFNIVHNESIIKVDFIIRKDESYREEEFARRKRIIIDGVPVWTVSREDLVLSKLVWVKNSGSELQFRDVCRIMKAKDIDENYLEKWSIALGVDDLVKRAKAHE
jgi:hypothetical protein